MEHHWSIYALFILMAISGALVIGGLFLIWQLFLTTLTTFTAMGAARGKSRCLK